MRRILFCLLVIAAAATTAPAQSTFASITGAVTDASSAAVPNAAIEVVNLETGYRYAGSTDAGGQYTIPNLVEGRYRLKATAPGFQEFLVSDIRLNARDLRRIDVAFQVGQTTTTVEVSAGSTLIETDTARIADVRVRQTMVDTPLSLRRSWDFLQLAPNISKTKSGFNIRFGGSRARQGDVTVDGVSISGIFGGPITGVVTDRTESYQEMRTEVGGSTAETPGVGQVAIVTRSGTNQLHGEAFNYYTSPGLTSRNPFSTTSTGSVEWVPGGSIGGPVYLPKLYNGRNRTFFFTSLEFERFGPPTLTTLNSSVPIAAWRRGDFSGQLPGTVVKDPFANNAPFASNAIPVSRLNPAAVKLQELFYPLPNFGNENVFAAQNNRVLTFQDKLINPTWVTRIDHRFNDKVFVNGRISMLRWPQNPAVGSLPTIGRTDRKRINNGLSFAYTHTLRSNLLAEVRYGLATDAFPETPPQRGLDLVKQLGFTGLAPSLPDLAGTPTINFTNLGLTGISNNVECRPCNEYKKHSWQGTVSWFAGGHTFKAGTQFGRGSYDDLRQGAGLFGNQTFSNRFTGFTYADFLLGIPTTMSRNYPAITSGTVAWNYGFFVQDEWKALPNLTVTLGLRYDLLTGFAARNGLQSSFDISTGSIVVPDGSLGQVSPLMPNGYVKVIEASKAGYDSKRLLHPDRNNFSPRIGLAWRPGSDNHTVIRSAFGVYYDIAAKNASLSSVPFNIAEPAFTNPTDKPYVWPVVFPTTSIGGPTSVSIPAAYNPNLRIPYSMQYSLSIERQQWDTGFRIAYIGTNTRQGVWAYNINQPVADSRPYVDKPRMFPQYPNVIYTTNGAGHQYNALTLAVVRPLQRGFRFQAYYTWARDIGDLEDGEQPEDAYNRTRERAVWTDVPTYRFSTNMTWLLPVGKGRAILPNAGRFAGLLVNGWQMGAIYALERGNFLTASWTGPDPTGTRQTSSRTPANVTIRPDMLRDPNLSDPTVARWFDASAFAAPAAGRFGNSAKGVIVGPGVNVMHLSLAKVTAVRERYRVRFEAVVSNALNHPGYTDPNLNVSNPVGVGVITNVLNRSNKIDMQIPRVLQLIVRFQF